MTRQSQYDVLIVGSGVAGLALALQLEHSLKVAVISKGPLIGGSSWLAQGGIAAVFDQGDSLQAHIDDTLVAGAGLCHEPAVRFVVENGPSAVRWLIDQGVEFTRREDDGDYHLTQEG